MRSPWIWWDNFAIPVGGWVTMWTRFVDFTGTYVFHCHILGHEERGMMQVLQIEEPGTPMAGAQGHGSGAHGAHPPGGQGSGGEQGCANHGGGATPDRMDEDGVGRRRAAVSAR